MGINPKHLRECIIRPALKPINLWSPAVEVLIEGTCAKETLMCTYLMQINKCGDPVGPALGPYGMESTTYTDILQTSNTYRRLKENGLFEAPEDPTALIYDLKLATIMCRLKYTRTLEKLPKHNDLLSMGRYWKKHYNTKNGKGDSEGQDWVEAYEKYI